MAKAKYIGNCTRLPATAVTDMIDRAKPVGYKYFLANVDAEELMVLFSHYDWTPGKSNGLRLKDDWHVRFYSSEYKGQPCVFIDHSSTEYVFLHRNN